MDKPPSAYRMWMNSGGRNQVKLENPGLSAAKLSQISEEKWNSLDKKDKKHWEDMNKNEWEKYRLNQGNDVKEGDYMKKDAKMDERIKDVNTDDKMDEKLKDVNTDDIRSQLKTSDGDEKEKDVKQAQVEKVPKASSKKVKKKRKLSLDMDALEKKKTSAQMDKKSSRVVSQEAHNAANENATIKAYAYKGNESLITFGGIHNKSGSKAGNSITIPTDILPIAGTSKDILRDKIKDLNVNEIAHVLKIHPDKSFGYTKDKLNIGSRILSTIDPTLIDEKGFPVDISKGSHNSAKKQKIGDNPLKYATETEMYSIAKSTIERIANSASPANSCAFNNLLSKISDSSHYEEKEHGVDRAVLQAISHHSRPDKEKDDPNETEGEYSETDGEYSETDDQPSVNK